jgi:Uma2 family endonuclease
MAVQLERHLFTLDEYERLVEAGGFEEGARIELIRGEIVDMAAIGVRHEACVARWTIILGQKAVGKAVVWIQNSIRLPESHSRPEPDVTLLRWRDDYYEGKRPTPGDVLLVVEVADTSVLYDRTVKGPLYAQASIFEYWIVNLPDNVIEVYSNPAEGAYRSVKQARRGDALALPGDLGIVAVSEILGEGKENQRSDG